MSGFIRTQVAPILIAAAITTIVTSLFYFVDTNRIEKEATFTNALSQLKVNDVVADTLLEKMQPYFITAVSHPTGNWIKFRFQLRRINMALTIDRDTHKVYSIERGP